MKKIIAFMLTFAVLFICSACGTKKDTNLSSSEVIEQNNTSSQQNSVSSQQSDTQKTSSDESSSKKETPSSSSKVEQAVSSKITEDKSSSQKEQTVIETSSEEVVELTRKEQILQGLDPDIYKLGLADKGNSARIASLMKKAQKGGSYTIGFLGGSITQGATTSSIDNRYANRVLQWWKENFPKAKFTIVNAGFGASNPQMACYRIETDLLSQNPDFVVIDFAVNTGSDYDLHNTYQSLLYRILSQKNAPAVMGITFTYVERTSYLAATYNVAGNFPCQEIDAALKKYQIPTMSYHNYVWSFLGERDEYNRKIFSWRDIAADYIHPNDTGHLITSKLITSHLDYVKKNLSSISTKSPSVPKPNSEEYLGVKYITNSNAKNLCTGGFTKLNNDSVSTRGWKYFNTTEQSKLTINLPANSNVKLFMRFEAGAVGKINIVGENSAQRQIDYTSAPNPTLMELGEMGNKITITPEMKTGDFVIYGVCLDK